MSDFWAHPWKPFGFWVLIVATVFAALALLSGCTGTSNPLALDYPSNLQELECGWVLQDTHATEPLPAGQCWRLAPDTTDRAVMPAGADACDIVTGPYIAGPGNVVELWSRVGGSPCDVWRTPVACP